MDKIFHQTAPVIALNYMSQPFQKFLICDGFQEQDMCEIATYPDILDHDNLKVCAEIHHAHSYKLDASGKWLDGDCIKTIEGLCAFTLDAWREYNVVTQWPLAWLAKYSLAKVTHYRIDAMTYPHLHRGRPWSDHHGAFERHMDGWIERHAGGLGDFSFDPYANVYKDCRQTAIEAWGRGEELMGRLEAGGKLTDQDMLMAARACVQGVGDLWTTLSLQMGMGG